VRFKSVTQPTPRIVWCVSRDTADLRNGTTNLDLLDRGTLGYWKFLRRSSFEDPATRWPELVPGMPSRPSVLVVTRVGEETQVDTRPGHPAFSRRQ
jgi:hypothetical protein